MVKEGWTSLLGKREAFNWSNLTFCGQVTKEIFAWKSYEIWKCGINANISIAYDRQTLF